ncbi:hypothetical protein CDAR_521621 [Caerostris darwini]|uniref:Uncharacterized protein n=1 Tax=Caerostris darwini TaxID=1538125 RepID=A0AAV4PD93_9ARAC|nr:hypothetical protein CDAR_521621 [Caerostris darwini]
MTPPPEPTVGPVEGALKKKRKKESRSVRRGVKKVRQQRKESSLEQGVGLMTKIKPDMAPLYPVNFCQYLLFIIVTSKNPSSQTQCRK